MNRFALCCLMLAIVAVWGWTFALMKEPIRTYGVVSFLAVRFVIASVVMGVFSGWHITWRSLKLGAQIGLVLAAAYLFQTHGLDNTTATNTGIITGLFIVFAPVANRVLFGVRTPPVLWAAIAISFGGLVLLSGAGPTGVALGDVLTLGAAVCFGVHIALLDRHAKHHDASVLAQGQMMSAAAVFLVVSPFTDPITWPTPTVWFALLVTAVLASAAGFYVQAYVQQRLRAVEASVIIVTEPLFAAFFGYLLVGDRLTWLQMLGGLLMVGALFLGQVYPLLRREREPLVGTTDRPPQQDVIPSR